MATISTATISASSNGVNDDSTHLKSPTISTATISASSDGVNDDVINDLTHLKSPWRRE